MLENYEGEKIAQVPIRKYTTIQHILNTPLLYVSVYGR